MKPWEKRGKPWESRKPVKKGKTALELSSDYKKQIAKEVGTLDAMLIGAGKNVNDLVQGVKQLVQGDDYQGDPYAAGDDYAALKEESPWATGGGEVLSELAQIAVPGGLATKGIKHIPKLGKAAPFVGDLAGATAVAGLKQPGEGSRLDNMQSEAAATIAGGVAGKALGKMLTGLKKTPGAEDLFNKGVEVPLRMATDSRIGHSINRATRHFPGLAPARDVLESKARESYYKAPVKGAALDPKKIDFKTDSLAPAEQSVKQVDSQFKAAYQGVWDKMMRVDFDDKQVSKTLRGLIEEGNFNKDETKILQDLRSEVIANIKKAKEFPDNKGLYLNEIDRSINATIAKAAKNQNRELLTGTLKQLSSDFRSGVPEDIAEELAKIDAKYPEILQVKRAAAAASANAGRFSPTQLDTAAKQTSGAESMLSESTPLYDIIRAGTNTIDKKKVVADSDLGRSVGLWLPGIPSGILKEVVDKPLLGRSLLQRVPKSLNKFRKGGGVTDDFLRNLLGKESKLGKMDITGIDEIVRAGRLGATANEDDDFKKWLEDRYKGL